MDLGDQMIMIDIETLGTASDSVILSIGATDGSQEFYVVLNPQSCLDAGLSVSWSTISWWLQQSPDARASLITKTRDSVELRNALQALSGAFNWEGQEVWCNGLNFDVPILETAYAATGLQPPWAYNKCRDYRTVVKLLPHADLERLRVEPKLPHHALEDAKAQFLTLQGVLHELAQTRNHVQD
jgi:hypothetical protein